MYICNYLTLEQKQNGRNTLPKILKIIIEFLLAKGRDDFSQNLEIWLKSNWSWIYHWMVLYNFFYVLIEILRWLQLQDKFLHRKLGMRGVFFISKTTNWFDPKQCMNQVRDVGSSEPLVLLCSCGSKVLTVSVFHSQWFLPMRIIFILYYIYSYQESVVGWVHHCE